MEIYIYIIVPYSYFVILPCLPVSTIAPVPSPKIVPLIILWCMCVHVCMIVIVLQFMPRACCMLGSVLPLRCIPAILFYFLLTWGGSHFGAQTDFELTVAQVSFELTILPS